VHRHCHEPLLERAHDQILQAPSLVVVCYGQHLAQGLRAANKVADGVLRALQQRARRGLKHDKALEKGDKRVRVEATGEVDAHADAFWSSATAT